jgi:hypothetical protein
MARFDWNFFFELACEKLIEVNNTQLLFDLSHPNFKLNLSTDLDVMDGGKIEKSPHF